MRVFSSTARGNTKLGPQLEQLIDSRKSFLWMTDANDVITYLSEDPSGSIAKGPACRISVWRRFIHFDDLARVETIYRRARRSYNEYHIDCRIVKTDGSTYWVSTIGVPRFSDQGAFLGYGGTVSDVTSRYRDFEVPNKVGETYRLLNENCTDLISQHAPDTGIYLYASASFKRILGLEPSELVGIASVYEHIHPKDENVVRDEILRQLNEGGDSKLIEFRLRHKDGHYVWVETHVKLLTDPITGRKVSAVAISRDATVTRAAKDALRKREERFRHLTTISSDWYWETDELDRFTFLPVGMQRPSRKPPEQLIGKTRRDTAVDPDEPTLLECFEMVAKRQPFKDVLYKTKGPNEHDERYVRVSGAPFFEEGVFRGYRGIGRDVTQEIETARELAQLADENKAIIENSPDIIAVFDREGHILRINQAVSAILGYQPDEMLRAHYSNFIHPESDRALADALCRARTHAIDLREFESQWIHKNGDAIRLSIAARWTDAGTLYLTARDVTERYRAQAEVQKSKDLISSMLEKIGDAFFAVDRDFRITYANTKAAKSIGLMPKDVVGKLLEEVAPAHRSSATRPHFERAMHTGEPAIFEVYSAVLHQWLEISAYPHEDGLTFSFRDVTDRRNAEFALRISEQRLRDIIQLTPAGYVLADANAEILDVNPALCLLAGYPREELVGHNLEKLFGACQWHEGLAIQGGPESADAMEAAVRHKDGHEVPVLFSGRINRNNDGHAQSFTAFLNDITKRKQAERRMEHLATHDTLTGLPNRAYLNTRVQKMLESAPFDKDFAVMFIDLDRFKEVNDSFGHDYGDALLCEVSQRLQRSLQPDDVIVRLGGDEFVVVAWCPAGRESASAIAEKLLSVLEEPILVADQEIYATASIGISMHAEDGHAKELLFQNADTAMYRAKATKRNCYRFFEPGMSIEVRTRMTLAGALRHALERNEFELHYQPRIDLKTMSVCAIEALMRWNHPEFGKVMPTDFIPIAEETGLIVRIGQWALEEACAQTSSLIRKLSKPLRISVNLSAKQLQCKTIVEDVRTALRNTNLAGC